jgi:hypothetical protein
MKKILKEPLVQFLTIGALLFFMYGLINTEESRNEIVVDTNLINELAAKWELKRNRQPSLQELKGLVNQYIEQEVLYREALAMNLDHNDEIVKRRLAQKMEFLSDGLAESLQPTEEMLVTYYEENKENYKKSPIYTMQQVYFSEEKRVNVFEDAKSALKSENPEELGDNISLSSQYTTVSALKIARDYGSAFATALDSLPIGEWTGPIYSGFGVHIIFITEKKPSSYFTFNEVAAKVNVDYNYEASNNFKKELIASLLKNYTININLDDSELKKELNEKY